MSWQRGRETVHDMIDKGELTRVVADTELAQRMLDQAKQHVRSDQCHLSIGPTPELVKSHGPARLLAPDSTPSSVIPGGVHMGPSRSLDPAKVDECLLIGEVEDALAELKVLAPSDELMPSDAEGVRGVCPNQGEAIQIERRGRTLEEPRRCTVRSPDDLTPRIAELRQRGDGRIDILIDKTSEDTA